MDQLDDAGPFDIIGDVHGCFDELVDLLGELGYEVEAAAVPGAAPGETVVSVHHPEGRRVIFIGDLTDRGPRNLDALRLAMGMCRQGIARAVLGNHDLKLFRWLEGHDIKIGYGLEVTIREFETASQAFRDQVREFIAELPFQLVLDSGRLVVAHAGLPEHLHGDTSDAARSHAIFGDTTGKKDKYGLPVRRDWGARYRGDATVVYGHTPMREAEWINRTICIDTGCVIGGKLTALRWPEKTLVHVHPAATYWTPQKPLGRRNTQTDADADADA